MKFNVEVECTPEEARRAIGLPDLTPIHERYVSMLLESVEGGLKQETLEQLTRNWAPMGEAGLAVWRRMFEGGLGKGGGG